MTGLAASADFAALAARLVSRAARLGAAHGKARTAPDRAWRSAGLLWPLFTKGAD